jgi:hypothetical protein
MMKPKSPAKPKALAGVPPSPSDRPMKQKKSSSADKAPVIHSDDSEVEVQAVPKTKSKAGAAATKSKPKPTPRFEPKQSQQDNDDQDNAPTANSKSKPSAVAQGKRRARDEGPGVSGLMRSPERQPPSRRDAVADDDSGAGEPKKKKKRVLGGALGTAPSREVHWSTQVSFISNQSHAFKLCAFELIGTEQNGSDLDAGLPSVLSPISTHNAPPRSFSGQQRHR